MCVLSDGIVKLFLNFEILVRREGRGGVGYLVW